LKTRRLDMLSFVIILKSKSSLIILAAAIVKAISAERMRQFELVKELGTLACKIENCRILDQDSSALQKQYNELAKGRILS
jgi:hypothetical protein